MNYGGGIIFDIRALVILFSPHCKDGETLDKLRAMSFDHTLWPKAHALFQQIRPKTFKAGKAADEKLRAQYLFEEICAKTFYNLSRCDAPFDPDSPYWVVPNALVFGRALGMSDADVLACVTLQRR